MYAIHENKFQLLCPNAELYKNYSFKVTVIVMDKILRMKAFFFPTLSYSVVSYIGVWDVNLTIHKFTK